jgi:hypothetical protein
VWRLTRDRAAVFLTLAVIGGCLFAAGADPSRDWMVREALRRQWCIGDAQIALLFALLTPIALSYDTPASLHACAACLTATALAEPALLVVAVPCVLVYALVPRRLAFAAAALTWLLVAAVAHASSSAGFLTIVGTTLPAASAVAAGALYAPVGVLVRRRVSIALDAAAVPGALFVAALWLPAAPGGFFLEHRLVPVKTLEIASTLPRGRWLIVAPVEQLAEAYGRGWYDDPEAFLARYGSRAADPSFHFNLAVDEVLVFVEKHPFKTYQSEPAAVPFDALVDPTFRAYRSPAGRASLEARLDAFCSSYSRAHADASIYYDDHDVTIYRFPAH